MTEVEQKSGYEDHAIFGKYMFRPTLLNNILVFEKWRLDVTKLEEGAYPQIFLFSVQFLRDFGPWKQGYKSSEIVFDPMSGELQEYKPGSDDIRFCQLILTDGKVKEWRNGHD
jgi:hypothetical protein